MSTGISYRALDELFAASVRLFHVLRWSAERIHAEGTPSAAGRGILREIHQLGPRTVPAMARARPVSRQHIQVLVNGLVEDGYLELGSNPAHKRSKLVRLTREGERLIERMRSREEEVLRELELKATEAQVEDATRLLRELHAALGALNSRLPASGERRGG